MSKLFTYLFNKRQTSVLRMIFTLGVSGFRQRPNEVNLGQVPHTMAQEPPGCSGQAIPAPL